MHASDVLPLDDAATQWQGLAERIERFVWAWEAGGEPPSIAAFLDDSSPVARRMTAVELIKIDLEYRRLRRGEAKPLEAYLTEFPFLADEPPVDLIYEECHLRRRAGETFDAEEACRRFPRQAAELRRLFGAAPALQTTTRMHHTSTVAAKLEPGDRVDDFELLARLGEGAFGAVYLARQQTMQRLVALKVTADRGNEPQTLAQLDHDHIIRVFDQRQLADRGLRLMYMQFAAGGTLEEALRRIRAVPFADRTGRDLLSAVDVVLSTRGETPPAESDWRTRLASMSWPEAVCFLGSRLAGALDYAHGRGVLHRDVKPANVLLTSEGSPKLADFNISFSSKLEGATPAAYFGGSLAYMSPEQLQACNPAHDRTPDQLDGRSDLYSLGVVLWEMLAGERPFDDERVEHSWALTLEQMTRRRLQGPTAHRLAPLVDDATPGLAAVLVQCLAAEPAERFASGRELARRLDLCRLPRTQRLLRIRRNGWRGLLLRHPVITVVVLTVLPNAVAGAFNYVYNLAEIVGRLGPNAEAVFQHTQMTINALLFPLGATIGTARMFRIGRMIADDRRCRALDDEQRAALRENVLLIGRDSALIGLTLWIFAGGLYPMLMHWGLGRAALSTYAHFFASMLLCGLIAAAYPFWLVTLVSVRQYYPLFVRPEGLSRADRGPLERLRRMGWFFLGLTALVPMTAVALLALVGSRAEFALATSAVGGMVGFVAALFALRRLLAEVDALLPLTRAEVDRPPTIA